MFKSIKEFFVGKPKVEEPPAECPYMAEVVPIGTEATIAAPTTTATVLGEQAQPAPLTITPETVTISISDNMNVSVGSQSDTITLTATEATPPGAWPFPNAVPKEPVVKKTRTPAIKATVSKPRKKK